MSDANSNTAGNLIEALLRGSGDARPLSLSEIKRYRSRPIQLRGLLGLPLDLPSLATRPGPPAGPPMSSWPPLNLADLKPFASPGLLSGALSSPNPFPAEPPRIEVHIFDVEHGACAAIITPSGRLMMIDCGHNSTTGWRPWAWVQARGQSIANLAISNFDEDHLSDLPNIRRYCQVDTLTVNWDVSPDWLVRQKTAYGIGPGVRVAVAMMREYDQPSTPGTNNWETGFSVKRFWNPPTVFSDENSLSVVTFIHCGGVRILFSGDMTRAGWCKLLENSAFVAWLQSSNILVAPHHGRADGYCPEMFRLWSPQVVIISDKGMMYDTQEVNYGQHARGITWNKTEKRPTTRSDGKLTITNMEPNSFWIDAKPTA